jgi:hypothetical protein
MTNMAESKLSIFSHPGKITGYWITTRSFPYQGPYWPGPIWIQGLAVIFSHHQVCIKKKKGGHFLGDQR